MMKAKLFNVLVLGLILSLTLPNEIFSQERKERNYNSKELKQKNKKAKKAKKTKKIKKAKKLKKIKKLGRKSGITYAPGMKKYQPIRHHGFYEAYYKRKYTSYINIGRHFAHLPKRTHPIKFRNRRYYFNNGFYYMPNMNMGFKVVLPPIGLCIPYLPGYDQVFYQYGHPFYVCNQVVYKKHRRHGNVHFKVVGYLRF